MWRVAAEEFLVDDGWKLVEVPGGGHGQRQRSQWQRPPRRQHRADGRAGAGERPPRHGQQSAPVNGNGKRHHGPGPGAAADALLLGGVHGRGTGEAQGPQAEASVRHPLDVRVGARPRAEAGEGGSRPFCLATTHVSSPVTSPLQSPPTAPRRRGGLRLSPPRSGPGAGGWPSLPCSRRAARKCPGWPCRASQGRRS